MTMRAEEYRELLRARPFSPLAVELSDGRSVIIRHPEQAMVTKTHMHIAIRSMDEYKRLNATETIEEVADDWILVNLIHIVSVRPVNGRVPQSQTET